MTANIKTKFKRTQYFVAAGFQTKYVGLILLLMFVTAALCSYVVYYTSMVLLGEKLASVYPQGRLIGIVRSVNWRILLSVALLTPVVALLGVYLSHKIAGPVYRIGKTLDAMASGDLRNRIVLRKGDELVSIANAINRLQESLRKTIMSQKSSLGKVIGELESLKGVSRCRPEDTAAVINNINRLEVELRTLIKEFDRYQMPPAA